MTKWFRSGSRPSAMLSFIVKDPSGEHRVTDTSTGSKAGGNSPQACHLLSVYRTFPCCWEGSWGISAETPAGVPAFGICVLGFMLTLGSFLSPAVLVLPHTCIFTGDHLAPLPAHHLHPYGTWPWPDSLGSSWVLRMGLLWSCGERKQPVAVVFRELATVSLSLCF